MVDIRSRKQTKGSPTPKIDLRNKPTKSNLVSVPKDTIVVDNSKTPSRNVQKPSNKLAEIVKNKNTNDTNHNSHTRFKGKKK